MKIKCYLPSPFRRNALTKKAIVKEDEKGNLYLQSYSTYVLKYNTNTHKLTRLWAGYSVTTLRHVNAFLTYIGSPMYGREFYDNIEMEVEN